MTKHVIAQAFQRVAILGRYYMRGNDTSAPSAPQNLQAVPHDTSIDLAWINGVDPDSGLKETLVEWRVNGTSIWSSATVPYVGPTSNSSSYTIPGLTAGTPYDVQVTNFNNATPPIPSAPTGLTVTTTANDPALSPGSVSLAVTQVTVAENTVVSIGFVRSGAGALSAAIEADWAISGLAEGTPSPANGTVSWAAETNGIQTVQVTAGAVTVSRAGVLRIVTARALSGVVGPTIAAPSQATLTIQNVATGIKKWNPGHYGASNNNAYLDDSKRAQQLTEINQVIAQPNVLGWKGLYCAGIFGNSNDFTKLFRDVNLLRAQGKRHMILLQPEVYGQGGYVDILPPAIYNSATYGASPVAGKYGWWTVNGGSGKVIAWWRSSVCDWLVNTYFPALSVAVNPSTGLTIDQDPYVEQLCWGETSIAVDAGSDYSISALVIAQKRLIDAWAALFPNTVWMCNNNYAGTQSATQQITDYSLQKGIAQGGPDIYAIGQRGAGTYAGLTWGQRAALGSLVGDANFTGPDLRGQIGMMSDIESPELSDPNRYRMYTPHSFFTVADQILHQSHMVWTMVNISTHIAPIPAYPADGVNTGASPGNWGSVLEVINGSPVTHVQKPTSLA